MAKIRKYRSLTGKVYYKYSDGRDATVNEYKKQQSNKSTSTTSNKPKREKIKKFIVSREDGFSKDYIYRAPGNKRRTKKQYDESRYVDNQIDNPLLIKKNNKIASENAAKYAAKSTKELLDKRTAIKNAEKRKESRDAIAKHNSLKQKFKNDNSLKQKLKKNNYSKTTKAQQLRMWEAGAFGNISKEKAVDGIMGPLTRKAMDKYETIIRNNHEQKLSDEESINNIHKMERITGTIPRNGNSPFRTKPRKEQYNPYSDPMREQLVANYKQNMPSMESMNPSNPNSHFNMGSEVPQRIQNNTQAPMDYNAMEEYRDELEGGRRKFAYGNNGRPDFFVESANDMEAGYKFAYGNNNPNDKYVIDGVQLPTMDELYNMPDDIRNGLMSAYAEKFGTDKVSKLYHVDFPKILDKPGGTSYLNVGAVNDFSEGHMYYTKTGNPKESIKVKHNVNNNINNNVNNTAAARKVNNNIQTMPSIAADPINTGGLNAENIDLATVKNPSMAASSGGGGGGFGNVTSNVNWGNVGIQAAQMGASMIDNYAQNKLNKKMLAEGVPDPTYLHPIRLDKNVDVSSSIAKQQDSLGEYKQQVLQNTTNSANAMNKINKASTDVNANIGHTMTDKYNQERVNRNQETLKNFDISKYNAKQFDDYKLNEYELKMQYFKNKGANVANLSSDIVGGINRYNQNKYQQEMLNLEREKYEGSSDVDVNTMPDFQLKSLYNSTTDPKLKAKIEEQARQRGFSL